MNKVHYMSDRARQDFSNATFLRVLSKHEKLHGTRAYDVFKCEECGKSSTNRLGAAIKRLIHNIWSFWSLVGTLRGT